MVPRRLVLAPALVLVGLVATTGPPAGARCLTPTIEHTVGTVDRTDTIHVVGTAFGTGCWDTGEPPEGQGVLGEPAVAIEVVLVQREVEHLVATGIADASYGFTVDVPIPDELTPGPVAVVARPAGGMPAGDGTTDPVVVSDVAPSPGAPGDEPVTFGRGEPSGPATDADTGEGDDPSLVGTLVVIVTVVALTLAVVVLFSRARQGPTGPRPV